MVRDRLGILCGIGSVACLAGLVVTWSQQIPVQRSRWEQTLFSDLATADQRDDSGSISPAPESPADISGEGVADRTTSREDPEPYPLEHVAAIPIEEHSQPAQTRWIQRVVHEQRTEARSVWLSGSIEMLPDAPASEGPVEETPPSVQYFPQARFQ